MPNIKWRKNSWFRVLRYGFCPSADLYERERKRVLRSAHVDIGDYPTAPGMTVLWREPTGPRALVCLGESLDDNPIDLVSTIAHECVHVAHAITEAMADREPSEEFLAYLVGGLVADIFADYSAVRSPAAKQERAGARK